MTDRMINSNCVFSFWAVLLFSVIYSCAPATYVSSQLSMRYSGRINGGRSPEYVLELFQDGSFDITEVEGQTFCTYQWRGEWKRVEDYVVINTLSSENLRDLEFEGLRFLEGSLHGGFARIRDISSALFKIKGDKLKLVILIDGQGLCLRIYKYKFILEP